MELHGEVTENRIGLVVHTCVHLAGWDKRTEFQASLNYLERSYLETKSHVIVSFWLKLQNV